MQAHTDAIGDFFHRIRGSRRPAEPTPPAPPLCAPPARSGKPGRKPSAISIERAEAAQHKRRNQMEAEKLFAIWLKELRQGDHVYRCMKITFDAACEEIGLDAITDCLFGTWLRRSGCRKRRVGEQDITMYTIAPRRSSPRLVAA